MCLGDKPKRRYWENGLRASARWRGCTERVSGLTKNSVSNAIGAGACDGIYL